MKIFKKRRRGFTLIEVVVSIVILLLALVVLEALFPVSFRSLLKSKQVTVATTLAQQKLEECLADPGKVPNSKEGVFGTDYPDYKYRITKQPVSFSKKLKELKIEVYRIVKGKEIIDAAVAQAVPAAGMKIYRIWSSSNNNFSVGSGNFNYNNYILSKTIDCPEPGVLKIDFKSSLTCRGEEHWQIALFMDGALIPGSENGTGATASWLQIQAFATTATIKVNAGSHTIRAVGYIYFSTSVQAGEPTMIIQYFPDSMFNSGGYIDEKV